MLPRRHHRLLFTRAATMPPCQVFVGAAAGTSLETHGGGGNPVQLRQTYRFRETQS